MRFFGDYPVINWKSIAGSRRRRNVLILRDDKKPATVVT
jgi:hypothetical protein